MAAAFTRRFRLDFDSLQFSLRTLATLRVGDKVLLGAGGLLRADPPSFGRRFRRWHNGETALRSMCFVEYVLGYSLDSAQSDGCSEDNRAALIESLTASRKGLLALQRTYAEQCEVVYKAAACMRAIQLGLDKAVAIHQRRRRSKGRPPAMTSPLT